MTPELTALTLAALLQVFQIALMAVSANLELKPGQTLGPRDRDRLGGDLQDQDSRRTARLWRAMNNHFEGLISTSAHASYTFRPIPLAGPLGATCSGWPDTSQPRSCWPPVSLDHSPLPKILRGRPARAGGSAPSPLNPIRST
jgi:hypothetical protein